MVKGCELCREEGRMYCEADGANLCWECDAKVHRANFLVAKHVRCLLCHVCHSPTSWKASGPKIGPSISICHNCVTQGEQIQPIAQGIQQEEDHDLEDEDETTDEDDDEYYDDEDEGGGENQVVPLYSTPPPIPPPVISNSVEEEEESGGNTYSFKRMRPHTDLYSDDEARCSSLSTLNYYDASSTATSSRQPLDHDEATSFRSSKVGRSKEIASPDSERPPQEQESRRAAVTSFIRRYQQQHQSMNSEEICKLREDLRRPHLHSSLN